MKIKKQTRPEEMGNFEFITRDITRPFKYLYFFLLIMTCVTCAPYCVSNSNQRPYDYKGDLEVYKQITRIFHKIKQNLNITEESLKSSLPCKQHLDANDDPSTNAKPKEFYEREEFMTFSEPSDHFKSKNIIQFRVSKDTQGRPFQIQNANLMLKLRYKLEKIKFRKKGKKPRRKPRRKIALTIHTVKNNGKPGKVVSARKSIVNKTTWFKMNLDRVIVEEAIKKEDGLLRFYVRCRGCKKGAKLILMNRRKRKTLKNLKRKSRVSRPVLVLQTKLQTNIRHKRQVEEGSNSCETTANNSTRRTCCRREVIVNLGSMGWDWLIYPTVIRTGTCQNDCDANRQCRPVRYQNAPILYLDDYGNVQYFETNDLFVRSCACF